MKIGIVTAWFAAGAGYVSKAYRQLLEKEHAVLIYARAGECRKGDPAWDDSSVTWAPEHYVSTGIWSRHFRAWIRSNKVDIIIFNEQRHWLPVVVAKQEGVIVGAYVDYYTQKTVPVFSLFDFLLCNTRKHFSVFSWHPHCFFLPWGIDLERFKPAEKPKDQGRLVTYVVSAGWEGLWDDDRRGSLLALESLRKVKGACCLKVFSQVPANRMRPKWRDALSADSRVELVVGTFDPFPFTEGDVYLYPSRLDGIGLSLPEAVGSGLAAIVTNAAPMNEFVINNYNGVLVEVTKCLGRWDGYYWAESVCDSDSLSNAMQRYLDDSQLLETHKRNARTFAVDHLEWSKNGPKLLEIVASAQRTALTVEGLRKAETADNYYSPNVYQLIKRVCSCLLTVAKYCGVALFHGNPYR